VPQIEHEDRIANWRESMRSVSDEGQRLTRLSLPYGVGGHYSEPIANNASNNLNADLVNFRPPHEVQQTLLLGRGIGASFHRIEAGHGPINLDYYPIVVTRLPSIDGHTVTAEELQEYIRSHIGELTDHSKATIQAYDPLDFAIWDSGNPLGAVMKWNMAPGLLPDFYTGKDDGAVVVSRIAPDHWVFSTISAVGDFKHPVSGNREFGFRRQEDGSFLFYTRGADRTTGIVDQMLSRMVFDGAHGLWSSFQQGLVNFVQSHGGNAFAGTPYTQRHDWDAVHDAYFHPTEDWLEDGVYLFRDTPAPDGPPEANISYPDDTREVDSDGDGGVDSDGDGKPDMSPATPNATDPAPAADGDGGVDTDGDGKQRTTEAATNDGPIAPAADNIDRPEERAAVPATEGDRHAQVAPIPGTNEQADGGGGTGSNGGRADDDQTDPSSPHSPHTGTSVAHYGAPDRSPGDVPDEEDLAEEAERRRRDAAALSIANQVLSQMATARWAATDSQIDWEAVREVLRTMSAEELRNWAIANDLARASLAEDTSGDVQGDPADVLAQPLDDAGPEGTNTTPNVATGLFVHTDDPVDPTPDDLSGFQPEADELVALPDGSADDGGGDGGVGSFQPEADELVALPDGSADDGGGDGGVGSFQPEADELVALPDGSADDGGGDGGVGSFQPEADELVPDAIAPEPAADEPDVFVEPQSE
jgi:hypothetical protein